MVINKNFGITFQDSAVFHQGYISLDAFKWYSQKSIEELANLALLNSYREFSICAGLDRRWWLPVKCGVVLLPPISTGGGTMPS